MAQLQSAFQEVALSVAGDELAGDSPRRERPQNVRFHGKDEVHVVERYDEDAGVIKELKSQDSGAGLPPSQPASTSRTRSIMYRFGAALLLLGASVSLLQSFGFVGHDAAIPIQGVSGGTIPQKARSKRDVGVERRDTSATNWCFKWAQQCS